MRSAVSLALYWSSRDLLVIEGFQMDKHRMRRRQPKGMRPGGREEDIKKAYSVQQLTELGAIALIWNESELHLHLMMKEALALAEFVWLDVTTRSGGTDGRIAVLRNFF